MINMNTLNSYLGFKAPNGEPSSPLPVQIAATRLRDKYKHVLNAGSSGTGQSQWLVLMMVNDAVYYPGNFILTGRKKLNWFKSLTLDMLLKMIPSELLIKWDKN